MSMILTSYRLRPGDQVLEVPHPAGLRHVGAMRGDLCAWFSQQDGPDIQIERRRIYVINDDEPEPTPAAYVGTVVSVSRRRGEKTEIAWHVFDGGFER